MHDPHDGIWSAGYDNVFGASGFLLSEKVKPPVEVAGRLKPGLFAEVPKYTIVVSSFFSVIPY